MKINIKTLNFLLYNYDICAPHVLQHADSKQTKVRYTTLAHKVSPTLPDD